MSHCPLCAGSGAQCEACLNKQAVAFPPAPPGMVQVGWRSRTTGDICDCPVYERSPHANSDPVWAAPLASEGGPADVR